MRVECEAVRGYSECLGGGRGRQRAERIVEVGPYEDGCSTDHRREKIISLLNLPPSSLCEYRSNRALLDAASKPYPAVPPPSHVQNAAESGEGNERVHGGNRHGRESKERDGPVGARRENGWGHPRRE